MRYEKTISSEMIYKGRALNLRVDSVELPDGRKTKRTVVEHPDCIAVVALDNEQNVLLVKQFRKAIEKELLEIPAGGIDPDEDVETAVKREMQEETGYLPQKLVKLGGFYSTPGYCTEYLHAYLATDLVPGKLVAEDTDGIELVRVPVAELPALLASGKLTDAKSIAGLYMFLDYKKRISKH
jgi:ADP-ribose pyrophosphatase